MTNVLIADGIAGSVLPLAWTLSAEDVPEAFVNQTDGFFVNAVLSWPAMADAEEVASGSIGACVEAVEATTGDPAICHVINYEGNSATNAWTGSVSAEAWNAGSPAGGPDANIGVAPLGLTTEASALGYVADVAEVEEDVTEEAVEEEDEGFGDEEEELDLQGADDGWAEDASEAIDEAEDVEEDVTDAADEAVVDVKEAVAEVVAVVLPSASFKWYQPLTAEAYAGQRRFGSGDAVQAYSLNTATDDEDVTTWSTTK